MSECEIRNRDRNWILTCRNRTWVHTVDGDAMRMAEFLCPHTNQGLISCLGRSIYSVSSHTEPGSCRRNKHNPTPARQIRESRLGQENRASDIAVKVCRVQIERGVDQIGLKAKSSTISRSAPGTTFNDNAAYLCTKISILPVSLIFNAASISLGIWSRFITLASQRMAFVPILLIWSTTSCARFLLPSET